MTKRRKKSTRDEKKAREAKKKKRERRKKARAAHQHVGRVASDSAEPDHDDQSIPDGAKPLLEEISVSRKELIL